MSEIYIILILILIIGCITLFIKYRNLTKKYQRSEHCMLREKELYITSGSALKQAEYLALQNQINPHFLYNTLEAIRGDAICEGATGIANTTKALATFFRYTITDVGYLVTLDDEINNIKNYFIIQQYRFGPKLHMDIHIAEEYSELLQAQIPKLTLQPIVENAISHGLEHKIGTGNVKIAIERTRENLLILITDDGIGIEETTLIALNERFRNKETTFASDDSVQNRGIALINVNSRIKLLFGDDYGIHIHSVEGLGTEVNVMLPLIIETSAQQALRETMIL